MNTSERHVMNTHMVSVTISVVREMTSSFALICMHSRLVVVLPITFEVSWCCIGELVIVFFGSELSKIVNRAVDSQVWFFPYRS